MTNLAGNRVVSRRAREIIPRHHGSGEEKNFVVLEKKRRRGTSGDGSSGGRDILVAGEKAKVDLVVVDQMQTYNASYRVPMCIVVDQSVN